MSSLKGATDPSNQPSLSLSDDNSKSTDNKSPSLLNKKTKREKEKTNRESCAICRDGGDLLLCDNCPKSFHMECLKLKKEDIPEGSWYCPTCLPKINRKKENSMKSEQLDTEKERKRLIKNEKRRLWRLKRKAMLKGNKDTGKEDINKEETNANGNTLIDSFVKSETKKLENSNICLNFTYSYKNNDETTTKALSLPLLYPIPSNIIRSSNAKMLQLSKSINKRKSQKKLLDSHYPNEMNNEDIVIEIDHLSQDDIKSIIQNPNSISKLNIDLNPLMNKQNYQKYCDTIREYWNTVLQKKNTKHPPKFPIDDIELYSFPDMYNVTEYNINKPIGTAITLIPQDHFSDLVQIFDFVQTFSHKLNIEKFTMKQLFSALKLSQTNYEWNIPLINEVFCALIKILLSKIHSMQLLDINTNMDDELMMIKIIIESIPSDLYENFLSMTWIELLRLLITSKTFNQYKVSALIIKKLKGLSVQNFYKEFSYEDKVTLLKSLIVNCYETDFIRDIIKEEQEKRNGIRKSKRDLEEEMRITDSRKRELERQEKFTQPQVKVDQLTKRLSTLSEDNPDLTRHQLAKLRKELEHEREQFKSVIKEIDTIENRRIDIMNKIEKLQTEIYDIPTMNKKCLGVDGREYKYFFFPWENDRIYIKCKSKGKIKYEWRELTNEDDIKELGLKLSEKGIKENALKNKLRKLYPKRMSFKKEENSQIKEDIEIIFKNESCAYINTLRKFNTSNKQIDMNYYIKYSKFSESTDYDIIANELLSLEEMISEYLSNDKKEWESFEVRTNIKAWLSCINKIDQYAKLLIMFNERNKSPYKSDAFQQNNKIITDDDIEQNEYSPIDINGNLDPFATNPTEVPANKTKLWSKEFESYALEDIYIEYLNNVSSSHMIMFAIFMFHALRIDLGKRRDYYKRRNEELIDEIKDAKPKEETKNENQSDNEDDDDDKSDEDYKSTRYTSKLRKTKKEKEKKKCIDWNETCMHCGEFGDLICCEDCPNVTHLQCEGLKKEPEIWRCPDCIYKLANRRITRSIANK